MYTPFDLGWSKDGQALAWQRLPIWTGPQGLRKLLEMLERETGFEPATDGLGSRCATPALLPLAEGFHS